MANSCGIILLAAGSSGRLGGPKQLLPYKGKTLLQYLVDEAITSDANSVTVVLGANAEMILAELQTDKIYIAMNHNWSAGMASSVRCGIESLTKTNPAIDTAILMMCDQPFVTTTLLNNLMNTHLKSSKPIVSCSFGDTSGPPVLFHKSIFPELLQLTGDKGARKVVEAHATELATIPFPEGNIDIDTVADYEALKRND